MNPTDSMTDDLIWDAAVVVAREMIRYRRSEPLSKTVISSEPNGTLMLTRDDYDRIPPGMSADLVISITGSEPSPRRRAIVLVSGTGNALRRRETPVPDPFAVPR